MANVSAFKYRAFISYSHADTAAAKRLHKALEGFRIDKDLAGRETATGKIPNSLRPVFRDRDDFTAGHTLGDQTVAALDASAALIVICSPASAQSKYVNEEVRLFKQRHPERPLIPLIIAGTPGSSASPPPRGEGLGVGGTPASEVLQSPPPDLPHKGGGEGKGECFPPALKFKLGSDGVVTSTPEPDILAADLRDTADGVALATAKVVARMLGLSTDDVFRRAERERRRKARVRNAVAVAFTIICIAGGLAFWDSQRKGETIAVQQQEKSQALAIARQLLGSSPAAAATPGQEQSLVDALTAIQRSAEAGDADYAKAFELLKEGRSADAVPLLLAAAEAKKKRAARENKDAAKAYREAAAIAAVAEPWRARELYAEAARLDPNDIDGMLQNAWFQKEAGQLDTAERAYRQIVANGKSGRDDWALRWALMGIGDVHMDRGDLAAAQKLYLEARVMAESYAAAEPGDAERQRDLSVTHNKVGDVLVDQGNLSEALKSFRDGLTIMERVAQSDPANAGWQRDVSVSYNRVGDVLVTQGNLSEALKSFRDGLAIIERLAKSDPENAGWQRDVSVSNNRVGKVLLAQGNLSEALKSFRDGLAIIERLAKSDPENAGWQRDLSYSHNMIGGVLVDQGNLPEALAAFNASLGIRDRLAKADPGNAGWQYDVGVSNDRIGDVQFQLGDLSQAVKSYQARLEIIARLTTTDPSNVTWQRDLSLAHNRLGDVLVEQGNLAAALDSYRASLAIRVRLANTDPGNADWQRDLAFSHGRIGSALGATGEREDALASYSNAREIAVRLREMSPENTTFQSDVAWYESEIERIKSQ